MHRTMPKKYIKYDGRGEELEDISHSVSSVALLGCEG